ncbi:GNAT family N-acetyltransferase [Leptolyngbya sp. FACHB-261]|uniref:GNAT family N-acetyltransferase n=1 Tax=Leptolyngbya sp. FACHB-261 TaxID=2692806 RepID=UPI001682FB15|nr:GNAT family N-acetyltransferase [Leptolyngbya sp. FACHB-261]MBD2104480.1 GNAT family N-acetyltransferase [Leptolyngbya sp. FACHB-261]
MSKPELTIRAAVPGDMDAIIELIHLKAEFDGCPEAVAATADQLRNDLFGEKVLASVLLAELEQEAIGFATYHPIYSTFLAKPGIWLDDLYVKAEYRSQHIGRALISRLCQIAQECGCGRVDWTVATNNPRGIRFYKNIGAKVLEQVRLCRLDKEMIARNAAFASSFASTLAVNRKI